jgi:hypothetical protein
MAAEQVVPPHQVNPQDLVVGEIYRIHRIGDGQNYQNDTIGTLKHLGTGQYSAVITYFPAFNKINNAYPDGVRNRTIPPNTLIPYPSTLHTYFKSGKTIVLENLDIGNIPSKLFNGYGGSSPIKRRSVRRRRVHRSIKRRNKSVTKSHVR